MNAVDPYRLIINDDYEKLFQALCRGLPMPDGVSLQDLVDDLRMAARTLTEEWDQAVEVAMPGEPSQEPYPHRQT